MAPRVTRKSVSNLIVHFGHSPTWRRLLCLQLTRRAASEISYPMADDTSETAPVRRVILWGRRFLAATVVVPSDVAELLNTDAKAVLAVIRDEARATGRCTLPVARIAERANIGRAKTRAAIRLAESLGLIAIEQEPGQGRAIINRGVTSR